jgi:sn-glycerol 3-phosphate transport system substrate-binding protein
VTMSAIQDLWARIPGYKVAYDELTSGADNTASAGPVFGDYIGVREAITAAEAKMFANGEKPAAALAEAQRKASATLAAYNARVR